MGWLYIFIYLIGVLIGQVIWGYRDPWANEPGFILAMAWPLILPFVGPYWICVYFFRYGRKLAKKEGRY